MTVKPARLQSLLFTNANLQLNGIGAKCKANEQHDDHHDQNGQDQRPIYTTFILCTMYNIIKWVDKHNAVQYYAQ